jgi:hypothetical protein
MKEKKTDLTFCSRSQGEMRDIPGDVLNGNNYFIRLLCTQELIHALF